MKKLFGTDGIRGVANNELTPELALKIGRITANYLNGASADPFFLIGKDTRISGDMLEGALVAGITSAGVDVRLAGVISTPGVAYLTRSLGACGGVVISASHNPVEYNGLKFFDSDGYKLSDDEESRLENLYYSNNKNGLSGSTAVQPGRVYADPSLSQKYLSYLQGLARIDFGGYRFALDCANGAVYKLAPALFKSLGAEVLIINDSSDGTDINVKCGSTDTAYLQRLVREKGLDAGLAFDGDADRLIAIDENGGIVDGDAIMAACASQMKQEGKLAHNTLVATIMSNGGLDIAANRLGILVVRTKVGDRYVLEEMISGGFSLGGEQSGHVIFREHSTIGDGLLTALQVLQLMVERRVKLSALAAAVPRLPQVLVNCQVRRSDGWQDAPTIVEALKRAKGRLGSHGRIVVRPSGTEPLMRIMVEGEEETLLHEIADGLSTLLSRELN